MNKKGSNIKARTSELLSRLNDGVYEKEEVIALSLLSSVAGESVFMLGAPGVAKSLVARRLKYAFKDGKSFEYLMSRFSTPDEIFGPVSISKLKDEDKYERIVDNYLPTASVVFLDEIWKAGPSIQNSLLTVLNEKVYRNGDKEIKVPIKALISASNELPMKGQGLEALWDRFLIRLIVEGVGDRQSFNDMISKNLNSYSDTVSDHLKLSDDELEQWSKEIDEVEIPENVFNVIHVIRNYIGAHNEREVDKDAPIYISDRRWRKIVRLLRTSAFLNGRSSADLMDCFLIKYCLWNEVDEKTTVEQFVTDAIQKHGYSLKFDLGELSKELKELKKDVIEQTITEEDTRKEVLATFDTHDHYEIIDAPNGDCLISKPEFRGLRKTIDNSIYLYEKDNRGQRGYQAYYRNVKKGDDEFSIKIDGKNYKLKTKIEGEYIRTTKKPHKAIEKHWDERVEEILSTTTGHKSELNGFKEKDLEHIRTNLFVDPVYADVVEANLNDSLKAIEKIELELKKIQNNYKNLKNGVVRKSE